MQTQPSSTATTTAMIVDAVPAVDDDVIAAFTHPSSSTASQGKLFSAHTFFISRECPLNSLHFSLASFGARLVAWDPALSPNSPFPESSPDISIQIADRPTIATMHLGRAYVQPQWVFDSINRGRLLDTALYAIGCKLPAHLSPFVEYKEGDYVPEEEEEWAAAEAVAASEQLVHFAGERAVDIVSDKDEDSEIEISEGDSDSDAEERELGVEDLTDESGDDLAKKPAKPAASKPIPARTAAPKSAVKVVNDQEEVDRKEMAKMMMSKKNLKLYNSMQRGIQHRAREVDILRRKKVAAAADTGVPTTAAGQKRKRSKKT